MNVAGVALKQRHTNTNLRFVEIVGCHAHSVIERGDTFLPAMSQFVAVPVKHGV
jgi:hypothetical protein